MAVNSDAAIQSVEKPCKIPDDVSATLMKTSIQVKNNQVGEAIALLKQGIEKAGHSATHDAGGDLRQNQQTAEAELLGAIIKLQPEEVQHYKNLALFQVGINQLDKAEATLREAIQKLPDNEAATSNLIDFLVEKRSLEAAIAELQSVVQQKPDAYALKFKLASLQMANKQADKAEATLKQVVEQDKLGPNGISARDKLAGIYAATKRIDEAKALIKEFWTPIPAMPKP